MEGAEVTDPFSPWHFVLDAIHDAARLALSIRAAEVAIIPGGVSYGDTGRRGLVTLAAYTQVLEQGRAKDARIDELLAANTAEVFRRRDAESELETWRSCCAVPLLLPSPQRGEGNGEGEIVEAADR